ncbi:unnamed protein product [Linum trigynum]|uniref:Uncharacterized protein n=1 Tax=Linum trigynum TaxID=586398 RepID=A0AAV2EQX4_9ROSI
MNFQYLFFFPFLLSFSSPSRWRKARRDPHSPPSSSTGRGNHSSRTQLFSRRCQLQRRSPWIADGASAVVDSGGAFRFTPAGSHLLVNDPTPPYGIPTWLGSVQARPSSTISAIWCSLMGLDPSGQVSPA